MGPAHCPLVFSPSCGRASLSPHFCPDCAQWLECAILGLSLPTWFLQGTQSSNWAPSEAVLDHPGQEPPHPHLLPPPCPVRPHICSLQALPALPSSLRTGTRKELLLATRLPAPSRHSVHAERVEHSPSSEGPQGAVEPHLPPSPTRPSSPGKSQGRWSPAPHDPAGAPPTLHPHHAAR